MLRDQQKEMRRSGLGASEVPVALGLSHFQPAAELAAVKRGELPAFEGNRFTHWGSTLEVAIVGEWLRVHREAGEDVSIFTPPTIRHPTSTVLLATADRVIVPGGRRAREVWEGLLEAKNVSGYRLVEFDDGEIPEPMIVQTQVQLEVLDLERSWLVALIGGNDWREFPVVRDREMGGMLVQFVEKWWSDHVVQGIPVPVDGSEASTSYLRRRYPADQGPLLSPTPEAEQLVARLRAAKAALKAAKEDEAAAGNALRALIGEGAGVAGLATWKANRPSKEIDWEGLAHYLGFSDDLAAKFTTLKPGARQLRLAKE